MNFNFSEEQYYYTTIYSSCDMTKGEKLLWEICRGLEKVIISENDINNLYRAIYEKSLKIHCDNKRMAYPRVDISFNRETTKTPIITIGGCTILFHQVKCHFTQEFMDKIGLRQ